MGRLVRSWNRKEWAQIAALMGVVAALHMIGFGALAVLLSRDSNDAGAGMLSIGVGVGAYLLGLRHAFDADHIAAIDNVTRNLPAVRARR